MALAEPCLGFGNRRDGRLERLRCHPVGREQVVQLSLLREQLVAKRDRRLFRRTEEALN